MSPLLHALIVVAVMIWIARQLYAFSVEIAERLRDRSAALAANTADIEECECGHLAFEHVDRGLLGQCRMKVYAQGVNASCACLAFRRAAA